ncbi:MAG: hypothetical protein WC227_00720 [Patescibacteria group bacterium]|jgi:hypothetical protein
MDIQNIARQFGGIFESFGLKLYYKELFNPPMPETTSIQTSVMLACIPKTAFCVSVVFTLDCDSGKKVLTYSLYALAQYKERWPVVNPIEPPEGWTDMNRNGLSAWYDNDLRHDSLIREYRQFVGPEIKQPIEDEISFAEKVLRHMLDQIKEPFTNRFTEDAVPYLIPNRSNLVEALDSTNDQIMGSTYLKRILFWLRAKVIIGQNIHSEERDSFPFKLIG